MIWSCCSGGSFCAFLFDDTSDSSEAHLLRLHTSLQVLLSALPRSVVDDDIAASEASLAAATVAALLGAGVEARQIGVICFYRAQIGVVKRKLADLASSSSSSSSSSCSSSSMARGNETFVSDDDASAVQVSTVDAFQGAERDVIVLSTVRASYSTFIDDPQRLNVALTRAKRHLIVLVHAPAFSRGAANSTTTAATATATATAATAATTPQQRPPGLERSGNIAHVINEARRRGAVVTNPVSLIRNSL